MASSQRRVYLDHAATSWPKPPEVTSALASALIDGGGNPGRGAHGFALDAARRVTESRASIARLLGVADPDNIAFQPGCTAALNLALFGLIRPGDRVVVSSMEHNSVVRPLHRLGEMGVEVVIAEADDVTGALDPDLVEPLVHAAPTRALIVQQASNVSGTIQPIADLADIAHDSGALMIVDGAQAGGHLPIELGWLGADVWTCSGHKGLLGMQGTGVIYLAPGVEAVPLVVGGTGSESESAAMPTARPDLYEAGTVNVPGIAALGAAAHVLAAQGDALRAEEQRLARMLHEGLSELGLRVLGPGAAEPRVPVVSVTASGFDAERFAFELDRRFGIAVRAGLHCAPWAHRTLGTLECGGAVRFSVGYAVTEDDIVYALESARTLLQEVPV